MNQETIFIDTIIILIALFLTGIAAAYHYQLRIKANKNEIKENEKQSIARLQRDHILNLYRLKYDDYYHKLKCEMYQSNDHHNIKVLTIEILEASQKRDHDMAIFQLIDLGSKCDFSYASLRLKLISEEQFKQLLTN